VGVAPRSFWKGYLKLSLVTCRVSMMPVVTDEEKVRFRTLNAKTGNPVSAIYVDAETGKPVPEDDQVKGYESGEGEYVLLEDDEIDAVALESTRTVDIERFVEDDSIGWIWYDRPHYMIPDDAVSEEAFSVIRDAMLATKTAGISRLVLYRRERAVLLRAYEQGMLLWTLRYGDEVRNEEDYFKGIEASKPDKKLRQMIGKLIAEKMRSWSPKMVEDPVKEKMLDLIAGKRKHGAKASKPTRSVEPPSNVVNIADALRKSLAAEKRRK
jgi:DNA end-binding protein Ku